MSKFDKNKPYSTLGGMGKAKYLQNGFAFSVLGECQGKFDFKTNEIIPMDKLKPADLKMEEVEPKKAPAKPASKTTTRTKKSAVPVDGTEGRKANGGKAPASESDSFEPKED